MSRAGRAGVEAGGSSTAREGVMAEVGRAADERADIEGVRGEERGGQTAATEATSGGTGAARGGGRLAARKRVREGGDRQEGRKRCKEGEQDRIREGGGKKRTRGDG